MYMLLVLCSTNYDLKLKVDVARSMAWFTCVNYYCFSYVVIYAPHVKDCPLSRRFCCCCFFFKKKSYFKETAHIET